MNIDRFPLITEQLLAALDHRFPEQTPTLQEPLDRIRERGGERNVVRYLMEVFRAQNPQASPEEGDNVQA